MLSVVLRYCSPLLVSALLIGGSLLFRTYLDFNSNKKPLLPGKYPGHFTVQIKLHKTPMQNHVLMQGYLLKSFHKNENLNKKINVYFEKSHFPRKQLKLTVVGTLYVSKNSNYLNLYVKQWFYDSSQNKVPWMSKVVQLKKNMLHKLKYLHPVDYEMLQSTVFANKLGMDKDKKQLFTRLGIGHLLVISGLHFVLILSMLKKITFNIVFQFPLALRRFSYHKAELMFSILVGGTYLTMIDFPISACRAFLFIVISQSLQLLKIKFSMFSVIFLTAMCILFFNPEEIFSLSFQFSFMCVFAIALFKSSDHSKLSWIQVSLGIFAVSQILTWYYFHVLNPVAWLSNIVLIPLFTIILSTYIAYVLLSQFIYEPYIELFSQLIHLINKYFLKALNILDQLGHHQYTIFSFLSYGFMLGIVLLILSKAYLKFMVFTQLMQRSKID